MEKNSIYTVYKITNNINKKIYVGCHMTDNLDDGYMGSGTAIIKAVNKYGKENFSKEYIFLCKNEKEMSLFEKRLVSLEFCERPDTYNLMEGGGSNGRASTSTRKKLSKAKMGKLNPNYGKKLSEEQKNKISQSLKGNSCRTGIPHSSESKRLISESMKNYWNKKRTSK